MIVSVIIPIKNSLISINDLKSDVFGQKGDFEVEIIPIEAVSPAGRARNLGANKAKGDMLVFFDCDIRLDGENVIENLVRPLRDDHSVGMTCAAVALAPDVSAFQKTCADQIPHSQSPVVEKMTDVQVASSACCAIRQGLFKQIGGFHNTILRGEDSVISQIVLNIGFRVVLVPDTVCFHSQPASLIALGKISFRDGWGSCYVDAYFPDLNLDVHPKGIDHFAEKKSFVARIVRFFNSSIKSVIQFKVLYLFSKVFYALGYSFGSFWFFFLRRSKPGKESV